VTGGIASGKSYVSDILEELGSPLIDFDQLARVVVEPGKPAFNQIVDFFGKQVLAEDGTLDRKKLSEIVFGDMEKRKKLEGFTHPAIYEEFFTQVKGITQKKPDAVIQVGVPLLIEVNMQFLFDKLLVVHVPPEVQVERLAKRDGITTEEAANILKSQLPIDEKVRFADYVIRNEGTQAQTREQVETLWGDIKGGAKDA